MTDFKKVAVTITDADGAEHRIVGYQAFATVYQTNTIPAGVYDDWSINIIGGRVKTEEIRSLPTGIGAVVRVENPTGVEYPEQDGDIYVRVTDEWWCAPDGIGDCRSEELLGKNFTVLSEGVEL